ncbi:MAG: hypothetical protein HFI14_14915 [Lachnospiraceae bacterium]|nr:hypothetical protein [Lachnospiraceae bacterium]
MSDKKYDNDFWKTEDYLVLWARFDQKLVKSKLMPDIERNCIKHGIYYPSAYKIYQQYKFSANCLYFHHSYAVRDIPMGQKYKKIALMEDYKILPHMIQSCSSKIICFFMEYKIQPSEHAMRGHHEISLIQFEEGIPSMIYDELLEVTEFPYDLGHKQICLY